VKKPEALNATVPPFPPTSDAAPVSAPTSSPGAAGAGGLTSSPFPLKTRHDIVENWLPRYTGLPLEAFGEHILLTNFGGSLDTFARAAGAEVVGRE